MAAIASSNSRIMGNQPWRSDALTDSQRAAPWPRASFRYATKALHQPSSFVAFGLAEDPTDAVAKNDGTGICGEKCADTSQRLRFSTMPLTQSSSDGCPSFSKRTSSRSDVHAGLRKYSVSNTTPKYLTKVPKQSSSANSTFGMSVDDSTASRSRFAVKATG